MLQVYSSRGGCYKSTLVGVVVTSLLVGVVVISLLVGGGCYKSTSRGGCYKSTLVGVVVISLLVGVVVISLLVGVVVISRGWISCTEKVVAVQLSTLVLLIILLVLSS